MKRLQSFCVILVLIFISSSFSIAASELAQPINPEESVQTESNSTNPPIETLLTGESETSQPLDQEGDVQVAPSSDETSTESSQTVDSEVVQSDTPAESVQNDDALSAITSETAPREEGEVEEGEVADLLTQGEAAQTESSANSTPEETEIDGEGEMELALDLTPMGMTAPTTFKELKQLIEAAPTDGSLTEIGSDKRIIITKPKTVENIELKPGQNILLKRIYLKEPDGAKASELGKCTIKVSQGSKLELNNTIIQNPWFEISGDTSFIDSQLFVWPEYPNYKDKNTAYFTVHESGVLTIKGKSYQGFRMYDVSNKAPFEIYGKLYVLDGNFRINKGGPNAAGVVCLRGPKAYMEMTGGIFQENEASAWWDVQYSDDEGLRNRATGGAISVREGAKFLMTGGEIRNNEVLGLGGGVYVEGSDSEFILDGGKIIGNSATEVHERKGTGSTIVGAGGGIAVVAGAHLELKSGELSNNKTSILGGAIYIHQDSSMNTSKILVEKNTAKLLSQFDVANPQGGGIWHCEFGRSVVQSGESLAIFDNTAQNISGDRLGAGDDICLLKQNPTELPYEITNLNSMMGGGSVHYYLDGGHAITPYGKTKQDIPRYSNGSKEVTDIPNTIKDESISLKSFTDAISKVSARKNAAVIVTGNTATLGGGIANNGEMVFEAQTVEVFVTAIWDHGTNPSEKWPQMTAVNLLLGNIATGKSLKLNNVNGWTGKFSDLQPAEYSIEAENFKDYKVKVISLGSNKFRIEYKYIGKNIPTTTTTASTTESITESNTETSAETIIETTPEGSRGLVVIRPRETKPRIITESSKHIETIKVETSKPTFPVVPKTGEDNTAMYIGPTLLLLGFVTYRVKRKLENL